MSTGEWVTLVISTNLVAFVLGAWVWWSIDHDNRTEALAAKYAQGIEAGRTHGWAEGVRAQRELQAAKDSARATKAAITRKANREASK